MKVRKSGDLAGDRCDRQTGTTRRNGVRGPTREPSREVTNGAPGIGGSRKGRMAKAKRSSLARRRPASAYFTAKNICPSRDTCFRGQNLTERSIMILLMTSKIPRIASTAPSVPDPTLSQPFHPRFLSTVHGHLLHGRLRLRYSGGGRRGQGSQSAPDRSSKR